MNNDLMTKRSEWLLRFMNSLDRMLDNVENMVKDYRPLLGGERYLTRQGGGVPIETEQKDTPRLPQ